MYDQHWWQCADGGLVNLWYVTAVNKHDPVDTTTGEPNGDPGISFSMDRQAGWLDDYPTAADRDIAFARLVERLGLTPTT